MFKITYRNMGLMKTEQSNDIGDVQQMLISIVNNSQEEELAYNWCSNARMGERLIRPKYMIECINEGKAQGLKYNAKATTNKEMLHTLKTARTRGVPVSILVYDDDTWRVGIAQNMFGVIQCNVECKYKNGEYKASHVTRHPNGVLECDFQLKQTVHDKIQSVFNELNRFVF